METTDVEITLKREVEKPECQEVYVNGTYIGKLTKISRLSRSFYEGYEGTFDFNKSQEGLAKVGASGVYTRNWKTIKALKKTILSNIKLNK